MIEIWEPRWHDKKVLIATYKVKKGINEIVFTRCKSLQGKTYLVESNIINSSPIESNGKIKCYAVPLDKVIGEQIDKTNS